jgi:glycosyltransferase involved in cell wall biosynthesis
VLRVIEVLECGGPGGTGNQVAAIIRGLDKARFERILVYAVRPGSTREDYEALACGADRYVFVPEMTREIAPLKDLAAWWKLYRLFCELKPDVVHAHSSKAGYLARTAAWAAGVPKIFYSPRGYSFLQQDRSELSLVLYRSLEISVSWIGTTVACSESEASLARGLLTARKVIEAPDAYLGDFPERAKEASGELVVCASGRMSYPRHPEAFVRLAKRAKASGLKAKFLWIGGGELEESVRAMAGASVEITGWLSHEKALERLRACDIFVHYSRWEGLANAVLEAMACELPVVASDLPANHELVHDGKTGWVARNEDELFARVRSLAEDERRRSSMGHAGRDLVKAEFGLGRLLEELGELYT